MTKVDISIGFYTLEPDLQSQRLCVISTPFGLFKYNRLPVGIDDSPDFFQSVMYPLFADLQHVEYFTDEIGIYLNGSFFDHLFDLHQVLLRLERYAFTVNPLKCEWAMNPTKYLGFHLIPKASNKCHIRFLP